MQEEITSKTIALTCKATKLTGRALAKMMNLYLQHRKVKKQSSSVPQGRQTVKELAAQGQGVSTIDTPDKDIKVFHKTMKKYGVDYAITKNKQTKPPTYTIFFKAKDGDAITKAFSDYVSKISKSKEKSKPSVLDKLKKLVLKSKSLDKEKVKKKEKEHVL